MIYPLAYLAYALLRASFAGEVPYPFLDITKNGAVSVAVSAVAIISLFIGLSALAVFVDHGIGRLRGKPATRTETIRR